MKKFWFEEYSISGACGISHICDFTNNWGWGERKYFPSARQMEAGCAWALIGFIDTPTMYDVYQAACIKYKLVYQSPVRRNKNSGNDFFFCIFDARK